MDTPLINASKNPSAKTTRFLGLNRLEKGNDGEFSKMSNVSSVHYPCFAPRPKHSIKFQNVGEIKAIFAPLDDSDMSGFCGVVGNNVYYNGGVLTNNEYNYINYIYNFCDNVNIISTGNIGILFSYNENKSELVYIIRKGTQYKIIPARTGIYCNDDSANPPSDWEINKYFRIHGQGNNVYVQTVNKTGLYIDVIKMYGIDINFNNLFAVGNELEIPGFTVDIDSRFYDMSEMSKETVVTSAVDSLSTNKYYMSITHKNKSGVEVSTFQTSINDYTFKSKAIYKKIPKMIDICEHNNRLWGVNPNGEYIYASALGRFSDFYDFSGISTDSMCFEVSTKGGFIAIYSFGDTVLAFKRDSILVIYGNVPSNYSVSKTIYGIGCTDARSISNINGTLYFLGSDGFYAYKGGEPALISEKLGVQFETAYGFGDNNYYYASAKRKDTGVFELLCYDVRYGLWFVWDYPEIVGAVYHKNKLYAATKDIVYDFSQGTEAIKWSAQSIVLYEGEFYNKGINEIWIRAKIEKGAKIDVYTSSDDEEYILHQTLTPFLKKDGNPRLKVYKIPVKLIGAEFYKIRLDGVGDCVIYDIERVIYEGGRQYKL